MESREVESNESTKVDWKGAKENWKGWMTLLDPTNWRQLALWVKCLGADCPKTRHLEHLVFFGDNDIGR